MRHEGYIEYTNLWFRWRWVRFLASVLGVVGLIGVFIIWLFARGLFSEPVAQDFLVAVFVVVPVAAVVCGVIAVFRTVRAASAPPQSPVNVTLKNPEVFIRGPVSRIDGRPKERRRAKAHF